MLKYHPDKNKDNKHTTQFIEITEAYDKLIQFREGHYDVEALETETWTEEASVVVPPTFFMKVLDVVESYMRSFMILFLMFAIYFFGLAMGELDSLLGIAYFIGFLILLLPILQRYEVLNLKSISAKNFPLLKAFLKSDIGAIFILNFFNTIFFLKYGLLTYFEPLNILRDILFYLISAYSICRIYLYNKSKYWANVLCFGGIPFLLSLVIFFNYFLPSKSIILEVSYYNVIRINRPKIHEYSLQKTYFQKIDFKAAKRVWGFHVFDERRVDADSIVYNYKKGFLNIPCVEIYLLKIRNKRY